MSYSKERIIRNINKYRKLRLKLKEIENFNQSSCSYNDKICDHEIIEKLNKINHEDMWRFNINYNIINIYTYISFKVKTQQYNNQPANTQQYNNQPTNTQQYNNRPANTQQYNNQNINNILIKKIKRL